MTSPTAASSITPGIWPRTITPISTAVAGSSATIG
jgi:hypothetical protein